MAQAGSDGQARAFDALALLSVAENFAHLQAVGRWTVREHIRSIAYFGGDGALSGSLFSEGAE